MVPIVTFEIFKLEPITLLMFLGNSQAYGPPNVAEFSGTPVYGLIIELS
jgi:hypothetical protein